MMSVDYVKNHNVKSKHKTNKNKENNNITETRGQIYHNLSILFSVYKRVQTEVIYV